MLKLIGATLLASISFTAGHASAVRDVHTETSIGRAMVCWQEQTSASRWDKYCDYR